MNLTWLFVAIVYVVAIAIARKLRADFPWRVAALFYSLVLIFLFRPLTGPYTNLPLDFLTNYAPWSATLHRIPIHNYELNDVITQMIPWAHQVRSAYRSGHVPIWNAMSGSGYPLLANAQSAALSPVRLLCLPVPLRFAFAAEAALKMLIAMSFMFAFSRRRWSELASCVGAVCFGFCTFIQVWLHFPHATAAAWLPACILTFDLLAERPTRPRIGATAIVWACLLSSGHPETAAHIGFVAALFLMWTLFVERRVAFGDVARRVGAIAAASALAALIASPALLPLLQAIPASKRYVELRSTPQVAVQQRDWWAAVLLFEPQFFGQLPAEKPWPIAYAEAVTAFAGITGISAWIALAIRLIVKRQWRTREAFFVLLGPIVIGVIFAWPGITTIVHVVLHFAANSRFRLILAWTVAALTAAIIDLALIEGPLFLLLGNFVTAAALLVLMKFNPFNTPLLRDNAILGTLPSLVVIASSALLLSRRYRLQAACVVFTAIVAELWSASRAWNPTTPQELFFPTTPLIRFLQSQASASDFRVVGTYGMLFPNTNTMYGLADIRTHDPMANAQYLGLLRAVAGYDTSSYFERWTNTETPILDYLNVRYVLTEPNQSIVPSAHFRVVYEGKDGRVYENLRVLPRFFPVSRVITAHDRSQYLQALVQNESWRTTAVVSDRPFEPYVPAVSLALHRLSDTDYTMRVQTDRSALIVSSIVLWPGWHVTVNGHATTPQTVNGVFLGFTVPAGDSNVRVLFRPTLFYVSSVVSLLAVCGAVVLMKRTR